MTSDRTQKRVVSLLSHERLEKDPRVTMESRCAAQAGFELTVLCWDRSGERAPVTQNDGFTAVNFSAASTRGKGAARQGLAFASYAWRALRWLLKNEWEVVHCHDLDTLPIGWLASRLKGRPCVFDAHEAYPEMQRARSKVLYHGCRVLELFLARRSSHIVTVGEFMRRRFVELTGGSVEVTVIGNWKDPNDYRFSEAALAEARAELQLPPHDLLVGFFGQLYRSKPVLPLLEAARAMGNVAVVIAGAGENTEQVKEWAERYPWVRYLGVIPYARVELLTRACDAMYYGLEPSLEDAIYSQPNGLFAAIAAARPLLTVDCGDVGEVVRGSGGGYLMPELTSAACEDGLHALLDPGTRKKLEEGARSAQKEYSVEQVKRRLSAIYSGLMGKPDVLKEVAEEPVETAAEQAR